jgi:hypothetical protein
MVLNLILNISKNLINLIKLLKIKIELYKTNLVLLNFCLVLNFKKLI